VTLHASTPSMHSPKDFFFSFWTAWIELLRNGGE